MTAVDIVALYDLDPAPALATARLAHCDLEFHRHRVTKDIWCIAVGPLGAFPFHVAGDEMLAHVRTAGQDTPRSGRVVEGFRVEIDENVAVVLRARGQRLEGTYVYANGRQFGGFGGSLPSSRRRTLRQFIADFVSGRRGSVIHLAIDSARADSTHTKP